MPAALAAPITNAIRRITGGDAQTRLKAAMSEVRRLQDELQEIGCGIATRKFGLLRKCAVNAPPLSMHSTLTAADPNEAWNRFAREHPEWRETLKQVCALKLAIARADYVEADERVRRELSDEAFRETEILAHPRLRRRSSVVNLWQGLQSQCESRRDAAASLWVSVVKKLKDAEMA